MIKIAILIPSYHRAKMLHTGLKSIDEHLIPRFSEEIEFRTHSYVQDATEEDIQLLKTIEGSTHSFSFVPKYQDPVIGKIVRDSIFAAPELIEWADYLILSDDDFIIINNNPQFKTNFIKSIEFMQRYDVKVASARLSRGKLGFSANLWPKGNSFEYCMYKERFIFVESKKEVVEKLASSEMNEYTVGEDVFLFMKSLVCGFNTATITGLSDFIHLQHEDGDTKEVLGGGYLDLSREAAGVGEIKDHTSKYATMTRKTKKNAQALLHDLFHDDVKGDVGRRIRTDLREYINTKIKLDENHNIQRLP